MSYCCIPESSVRNELHPLSGQALELLELARVKLEPSDTVLVDAILPVLVGQTSQAPADEDVGRSETIAAANNGRAEYHRRWTAVAR